MHIIVSSDLCCFTLAVDASDTIDNVKEQIFQMEGIAPDQQLLWLNGKPLEDGHTLSDYQIAHGEKIDVFGPCKRRRVGRYGDMAEIFVTTLGGKTITLDVEASDVVYDVKAMIQKEEGIPKSLQRLFFNGEELDDVEFLSDYSIWGGCTIQLVKLTPDPDDGP